MLTIRISDEAAPPEGPGAEAEGFLAVRVHRDDGRPALNKRYPYGGVWPPYQRVARMLTIAGLRHLRREVMRDGQGARGARGGDGVRRARPARVPATAGGAGGQRR